MSALDTSLPDASAAPAAARGLRPILRLGAPLVGWFLIYNLISIA